MHSLEGGEERLAVGQIAAVLEQVQDPGFLVQVVADARQLADELIQLPVLPPGADRQTLDAMAHDIADGPLCLARDRRETFVDLGRESDGDLAAELDRR